VIHLATGLAIRDGRVLLVASRYPNHAQPLWNLPGGRQRPGELLEETVAREVLEETGLQVDVEGLAYVSESYDRDVHYLNATFIVVLTSRSYGGACPEPSGRARDDTDHVVATQWVRIDDLAERIVVGVVREPLLAYLRGELPRQYAGYHEAGVTIEWPADSR
jgi:ADP-ribose pyrophosphatase YjhB (NUDIX family)